MYRPSFVVTTVTETSGVNERFPKRGQLESPIGYVGTSFPFQRGIDDAARNPAPTPR